MALIAARSAHAVLTNPPNNIAILHSAPLPEFILDLAFFDLRQGTTPVSYWPATALCAELNTAFLWQPGDEASALNDHLLEQTQLTVGEQTLSNIVPFSLLTASARYTEDGGFLGSWSDIRLCFGTDDLPDGTFEAHLHTESTSGSAHYHYTFSVAVE